MTNISRCEREYFEEYFWCMKEAKEKEVDKLDWNN